jgi:hypothetical protein
VIVTVPGETIASSAAESDCQIAEEEFMARIPPWLMATIAVVRAVLGGRADSAQDEYTLQHPNGLAFSDFRGYDWGSA